MLGSDRAQTWSWIQFGGTAFLLTTCQMHILLINRPAWVAALYLCFSLLGIAAWRGTLGTRLGLTTGVYLAAFSIAGRADNMYWGLIYAALLPLGCVWGGVALRDLFQALARPAWSSAWSADGAASSTRPL